ncbi:hypothetical protein AVEN_116350-1 [Araneus ventricosus]|uniref:Mutator-like transposase domain-containing protein n=1 Tax=Araneus ventricosus TaxID=182803 RepID=A0A4Y2KRC2_ARAVE|nr:hypothetical protein AVEN_116350-1 [Araneus ventricosus]
MVCVPVTRQRASTTSSFAHVDRTTTGPRSLTGEIRKSLAGCEKLSLVSSTPIEYTLCEVTNKKDLKERSTLIRNADDPVPTVKCGVTVDGTWQQRGYSSPNGVVSAISILGGKVIHMEVMSQFCKKCNTKTSPSYLAQKHQCANHKGSSGYIFVELQTLRLGSSIAVLQFNDGFSGIIEVLKELGITPGHYRLKHYSSFDTVRIATSKR